MKKLTSKIALIASLLAVTGMFTAPAYAADDKADAAAAKKAKHDAEMLKKYDKNGNGKLDADELATMKSDEEKAKAEKKAEKKEEKKEEKKAK
jgi:hypothetical protein